MKKTLRGKFSYSNVISTLCLFLVLGGGTAFAASHLGKNSVGTKQLKKHSVTAAKIKKNAITTAAIKNGSVTGAKVNTASLGTVPSASTAGTAGTAASANSAATLAGYSRKGMTRVSAFSASSYEDGIDNSPQTVLFTAGPLTIYAQCFTEGTSISDGIISIKTSQNGAIFNSDESDASGYTHYLDTNTEAEDRELLEEDTGTNEADYFGGHNTGFAAMAPDGTTIEGNLQIAVKNGTLPAGNGVYGDGNVCLFAGDMTVLNG
jgi:hypothetical protein